MHHRRTVETLVIAALVLTGCGDDEASTDAGVDAAVDSPFDIPWLAEGSPVSLAPCPEGYREVSTAGGGIECDPYPETGIESCGRGSGHFPGEPGCSPIGDPCPGGDFADSLPTDGTVMFVRPGATAGDGSMDRPFGSLGDVSWGSLSSGTTVALSKGTFPGTLPLRAGVQVVGACAVETVVTGVDAPVPAVLTVTTGGDPAVVRNLTIEGPPTFGVRIEDGRSLRLEGVEVAEASDLGVVVLGPGTTLTAFELVVRDTAVTSPTGTQGRGIDVEGGAHFEATRLDVVGNHDHGLFASFEGTTVLLEDAVVRDTGGRVYDGTFGIGMAAINHARLEASRLVIANNTAMGIGSSGIGTEVVLTDVVVRGTRPEEASDEFGRGVNVQEGAHLTASRLTVAGNREVGLRVANAGSDVVLTDAIVRDTSERQSDGTVGRGVELRDGARLSAERIAIVGNTEIGLFAHETESVGVLVDALIRDTRPRPSDDSGGVGIWAQTGAGIEGTRVRIEEVRSTGLMAIAGATVALVDASIVGVDRAACATTTCAENTYGFATASIGGSLRITDFEIREAASCGVMVAPFASIGYPTEVDLSSGTIASSTIGACVQIDGYDLSRLEDDVRYLDNDANLDVTMLPVPEVIDASP